MIATAGAATATVEPADHDRVDVLGCQIDSVDMDHAGAVCERAVQNREAVQHVAINASKLVAMQSDPELRRVIEECELVTADGQAVVWASRLLGRPLPCRVAGIDLMHRLFDSAEQNGFGVYILGARTEVLEEAVRRIREQHPSLRIAGYRHGYFEPSEDRAVADEIAAASPDMLFVAMSTPRKEQFIAAHRDRIGVPFVMGVGGAIDVVSGLTRRAPLWMQRAGLEWLFRLCQEPRRLMRRYLVTNTAFVMLTLRGVLGRRRVFSRPLSSRT